MDRWKEVEERSLEELRKLTPEQKLHELSSLMRSAHLFGDFEQDRQQDMALMDLWMLLRARLRDETS